MINKINQGKYTWILESIQDCNRHELYRRSLDLMESNNAEDKAIASLIQKILYINSLFNYENYSDNILQNKKPERLEMTEKNIKILNCR